MFSDFEFIRKMDIVGRGSEHPADILKPSYDTPCIIYFGILFEYDINRLKFFFICMAFLVLWFLHLWIASLNSAKMDILQIPKSLWRKSSIALIFEYLLQANEDSELERYYKLSTLLDLCGIDLSININSGNILFQFNLKLISLPLPFLLSFFFPSFHYY